MTVVEISGEYWYNPMDPRSKEYYNGTIIRYVRSARAWMIQFVEPGGTFQDIVEFDKSKWRYPADEIL